MGTFIPPVPVSQFQRVKSSQLCEKRSPMVEADNKNKLSKSAVYTWGTIVAFYLIKTCGEDFDRLRLVRGKPPASPWRFNSSPLHHISLQNKTKERNLARRSPKGAGGQHPFSFTAIIFQLRLTSHIAFFHNSPYRSHGSPGAKIEKPDFFELKHPCHQSYIYSYYAFALGPRGGAPGHVCLVRGWDCEPFIRAVHSLQGRHRPIDHRRGARISIGDTRLVPHRRFLQNQKELQVQGLPLAFGVCTEDICSGRRTGEEQGHHPDISFGWGYCSVIFYTHKIAGLHKNDFIMAAKVDALYDESTPGEEKKERRG
jgi:hypothetical protein